jgi:hypothetical protein
MIPTSAFIVAIMGPHLEYLNGILIHSWQELVVDAQQPKFFACRELCEVPLWVCEHARQGARGKGS